MTVDLVKTAIVFHVSEHLSVKRLLEGFFELAKEWDGDLALHYDLSGLNTDALSLHEIFDLLDTAVFGATVNSAKLGELTFNLYPWLKDACEMCVLTGVYESEFKRKIDDFWCLSKLITEKLEPVYGYTCTSDMYLSQSDLDAEGYSLREYFNYFNAQVKQLYPNQLWSELKAKSSRWHEDEKGLLFYLDDDDGLDKIYQQMVQFYAQSRP